MKKWMMITGAVLLLVGVVLSVMNKDVVSSGQYAMGYFASGQFAAGVFAAGQFSIGVFSIGIFSIGVFSLGIFNIGIYTLGFFILWKQKGQRLKGFDVLRSAPRILVLLFVVSLMGQRAYAQIPNGDFESWVDHGGFLTPVGFVAPNALSQNGVYAISRTADVPASSEGQYAVRIESKPSILPQANAYGLLLQNPQGDFLQGIRPTFPVDKHYVELRGRVKYFPDNGDAMLVLVLLYKDGQVVAQGIFSTSDTISNWSDFSLNISNYQTADSCALLLGSYYAMGGPPEYKPLGNSVLFIDDLELKGGTASSSSTYPNDVSVYPNPTPSVLYVQTQGMASVLTLFSERGQHLLSLHPTGNTTRLDLNHLPQGIYYLKIREEHRVVVKKVVVGR